MNFSCAIVLCALSATLLEAEPTAGWPQWRGPTRDGISNETGLLKEWKGAGPPVLWRADGLGGGFSSVVISDGRIFTLGQFDGITHLIALDVNGGKELWRVEVGPGEPNCTPTVADDLVFCLGREGELVCVHASNGREIWRKSFPRDFGGKMMSGWGFSESPLVDGDKLICTPGGNDAVIVALEKSTGKEIWRAKLPDEIGGKGKDGAAYSSVVISEASGLRQYVQLTGRGVISVAAKDGRFLWSYNRIANPTANVPTPIAYEDYIFCSTGYGTGAALLKLSSDNKGSMKAEEVYFLEPKTLQNHHGGMILLDGRIYCGHGHNRGAPICVDLKTGEVEWISKKAPGGGSAAVVYADGHFYFRYEDGVVALIEANPKQFVLKGTFETATKNGKGWPHPAIADGKLYMRDQGTLLCYTIR